MSNIDPREIASFADLVAKMNQLDRGEAIKTKSNHISEGLKANDMTSILENMYGRYPSHSKVPSDITPFPP